MRIPRKVTRFLLVLLAIEIAVPLLLVLARNKLMFFPSSSPAPVEGLPWLERATIANLVRIPHPEGRELAAYDARPRPHPADGDAEPPVVVFFHGNAGNIAHRADLLAWFVEGTGARVILFDYSGYGGNEGSPSEDACHADGLAVLDWLQEQGIPPGRVVLYGESIGGAVALGVAAERGCAGIVVQSSFASLSSMALRTYPFFPLGALLVRGSFPGTERIAGLRCPVLVTHGAADRMIPISEGRKLHAAAPDAEFVQVTGAGHNDFFEVAGRKHLEDLGRRFREWTEAAGD